jgi:hypothetical protein
MSCQTRSTASASIVQFMNFVCQDVSVCGKATSDPKHMAYRLSGRSSFCSDCAARGPTHRDLEIHKRGSGRSAPPPRNKRWCAPLRSSFARVGRFRVSSSDPEQRSCLFLVSCFLLNLLLVAWCLLLLLVAFLPVAKDTQQRPHFPEQQLRQVLLELPLESQSHSPQWPSRAQMSVPRHLKLFERQLLSRASLRVAGRTSPHAYAHAHGRTAPRTWIYWQLHATDPFFGRFVYSTYYDLRDRVLLCMGALVTPCLW